MAAKSFTYIAMDRRGERQTGSLSATTEAQARDQLTRQGLLVEHVSEAAPPATRSIFQKNVAGPLVGKVPYDHLSGFFRQLAAMHRAGVPLVQALDTLAKGTRHNKLRAVVEAMRARVVSGGKISEVMDEYPEVFSALQVALVKAGEHGGVLDKSLDQVNEYLQREIKLRNQIKSYTFYPKLLLAVAAITVIVANIIIAVIASQTGGPRMFLEMPFLQPGVLMWLVPALVGAFLFFRLGVHNPKLLPAIHKFFLGIPYFGHTLHMLAMAKFGRAFAALYAGGVPMGNSIRLAADSSGNEHIRQSIYPAAGKIEEGAGVAKSMAETGAFTDVALEMAATGEQTGNLDGMLDHMAAYYEGESEVRVEKSAKTTATVVLIIVLLLVAYGIMMFWINYFGGIVEMAGE
ncbi:MAG: type II secretion system F family protein [Fimbriimonadales bacterium]